MKNIDNEIQKCPACGQFIDQTEIKKCSACGQFIDQTILVLCDCGNYFCNNNQCGDFGDLCCMCNGCIDPESCI